MLDPNRTLLVFALEEKAVVGPSRSKKSEKWEWTQENIFLEEEVIGLVI